MTVAGSTIEELFRDKQITTKTRGKSIASKLGLKEPFNEEQAKVICEIDSLMSAKTIRSVPEGIRRHQSGERAVQVNEQYANQTTEEKVNVALAKNTAEQLEDQIRAIDRAAEIEASRLEIVKNYRKAHYLASGEYKTPIIKERVERSKQMVLDILLMGNIADEASILEQLDAEIVELMQQALPEANNGLENPNDSP